MIENDNDAAEFCQIAAQVVADVKNWQDVPEDLRKIYEEYTKQLQKNDSADWDRGLWDYRVKVYQNGPVNVELTFGTLLLHRLGLC